MHREERAHPIMSTQTIKTTWRISEVAKTAAGLALGVIFAFGGVNAAKADGFDRKSCAFLKHTIASRGNNDKVSVIVTLDATFAAADEAKLLGAGHKIFARFPAINAIGMTLPVGRLRHLAALPFVKVVSENVVVHKTDEFSNSRSGADIAFSQYGLAGDGVTVAVIDSGITTTNDLRPGGTSGTRVVTSVNFSGSTTPHGHGTHVAGIIAGNGYDSSGTSCYRTFYGIARSANLASVRVLDGDGNGTVSSVLSGIQWCIDNRLTYNIRVMNLSLGHAVGESYTTDPLCQAVAVA